MVKDKKKINKKNNEKIKNEEDINKEIRLVKEIQDRIAKLAGIMTKEECREMNYYFGLDKSKFSGQAQLDIQLGDDKELQKMGVKITEKNKPYGIFIESAGVRSFYWINSKEKFKQNVNKTAELDYGKTKIHLLKREETVTGKNNIKGSQKDGKKTESKK